jgi:hypothetical protein
MERAFASIPPMLTCARNSVDSRISVDAADPETHGCGAMKRPFAFLLLLGAMIGLFGQEMAFASSVRITRTSTHSAMMLGCTMPMVEQKQDGPCKGLTLECIEGMGCAIPLAHADEPAAIEPVSSVRIAPVATATKRLMGLHVLPEPEPPHSLI